MNALPANGHHTTNGRPNGFSTLTPFLAVTPQDGLDRLTLGGGITYETPALFVRGDVAGEATLDPEQWLSTSRNQAAKGAMNLKAALAH